MTQSDPFHQSTPMTDPPPAVVPAVPPAVPPATEGAAFHEQVRSGDGRSTAARAGIVAGSAILVVVGIVAAMGASPAPSPASDPSSSGTGAGPSAPAASAAPGTKTPDRVRPGFGGPAFGMPGMPGMRDGLGAIGGFGRGGITVTAIDGSNVSLKTDDGWTRTITVTASTTITKGGATIAVGDLAVGDHVGLRQDRAADGTYSVTAIVVVLPTVVGQVTAVDGQTLTVTQPGGTSATIHVGADTTYQVDGTAGSLSDVKVGSFIVAEGTQRSDGSLDAAAVRAGDLKRGFPGGHGGQKVPDASPAPSSGAS
jgi:hypothetical protein